MKASEKNLCIWQRMGEPWPHNRDNYWLTSCGCADHGKLALGLCPHCAKPVEGATLKDEHYENTISAHVREGRRKDETK